MPSAVFCVVNILYIVIILALPDEVDALKPRQCMLDDRIMIEKIVAGKSKYTRLTRLNDTEKISGQPFTDQGQGQTILRQVPAAVVTRIDHVTP